MFAKLANGLADSCQVSSGLTVTPLAPLAPHRQIPFIDYPEILDVRTRPNTIQTLTGSKDLQMVSITLRVLTRPDTHKLPQIYRELGRDYDERVLPVTRHRRHNSPMLLTSTIR